MTIRARILSFLLPTLIGFVSLIFLFFYFNWYQEIITSFRSHLKSIVVSGALSLDASDVAWFHQHQHDPHLQQHKTFQNFNRNLYRIKEKLPLTNIYIVRLLTAQKDTLLFPHNFPAILDRKVYLLHSTAPLSFNSYDSPKRYSPFMGADKIPDNEKIVYETKKPLVTSIYTNKDSKRKLLTGYAPIFNERGDVVALFAADLNIGQIDQKLQNAILIILLSAFVTIIFVIVSVYYIANKISQPVNKLKNVALSIASGKYGEKIDVQGPQEITELAHTLNTMSECLHEQVRRMEEDSAYRERMHGEYECSQLLQHQMMQKVIDHIHHPNYKMKMLKVSTATFPYGLYLHQNKDGFTFSENKEKGFQGIYQLLKNPEHTNASHLNFSIEEHFTFSTSGMPLPQIWSVAHKRMKDPSEKLENGDLVFLFNSGFEKCFIKKNEISTWFTNTLKHFSLEEHDLILSMLYNQLNFLAKKHPHDHDLVILAIILKST